MLQFTVFPSPTPNLVNCLKYIKNTSKLNKSLVYYRVFFALIMCRYLGWFCTIHKTTRICLQSGKKTQNMHFLGVFTRFQTIANSSIFTVLPHPTQNIENSFTILHKIMLIWTKVSCIIVFSLRWLFIGFYRAPGAYVN